MRAGVRVCEFIHMYNINGSYLSRQKHVSNNITSPYKNTTDLKLKMSQRRKRQVILRLKETNGL